MGFITELFSVSFALQLYLNCAHHLLLAFLANLILLQRCNFLSFYKKDVSLVHLWSILEYKSFSDNIHIQYKLHWNCWKPMNISSLSNLISQLREILSKISSFRVIWNAKKLWGTLPQKKNGKMWEFFPNGGPPPSPLFGNDMFFF